jgi:hypothetical protein
MAALAYFGTQWPSDLPVKDKADLTEILKFAEAFAAYQTAKLQEENAQLRTMLRCNPEETIEDGFGSRWSKTCPMCGLGTMHVNRPGEAQCDFCG